MKCKNVINGRTCNGDMREIRKDEEWKTFQCRKCGHTVKSRIK